MNSKIKESKVYKVKVDMSNTVIEVISILAGFVAIWINEVLTHRRDKRHKKEELMLSHLKEMLEWLNEMQQDMFKVSRMLITSIGIYSDLDRKKQLQRDFQIAINEVVEKSIIFCGSYAEINNSIGIDLELSELNRAVGQYADELRNVYKMYHFPDKDNIDLDIVNEKSSAIQKEIKKRIYVISREISNLLTK
ncbi:MAG: hypothetical protein HDT13_00830 [Butyrivibrio sp.]|nr:hypothetical protein [Butyrivibrio sp.]